MKKCCEEWMNAQFGDDPETIATLYAEYVATIANLSKQLAAVREKGDPAELDVVLHTIKGTAAMAGDAELSKLANDSRATADAASLDAVARMMKSLLD